MFQPGQYVEFSDLLAAIRREGPAKRINKISVLMPDTIAERQVQSVMYESFIAENCAHGAWTKVLWSAENGSDLWLAYYFESHVDAIHFKMRFG